MNSRAIRSKHLGECLAYGRCLAGLGFLAFFFFTAAALEGASAQEMGTSGLGAPGGPPDECRPSAATRFSSPEKEVSGPVNTRCPPAPMLGGGARGGVGAAHQVPATAGEEEVFHGEAASRGQVRRPGLLLEAWAPHS